MEIANMILNYVQVLVWPILIGVALFYFFRSDIRGLLQRLLSAKVPGGEFQFQPQGEPEIEASLPLDIVRERGSDIKERYDQQIHNKDEQIESLFQELAKKDLQVQYEATYNQIFGSQLSLLEYLSTKGSAGATYLDLYTFFYAPTVGVYPSPKIYTFERYLGFLVTSGLIEEHTTGRYRITPLGIGFLEYIAGRGYPMVKRP